MATQAALFSLFASPTPTKLAAHQSSSGSFQQWGNVTVAQSFFRGAPAPNRAMRAIGRHPQRGGQSERTLYHLGLPQVARCALPRGTSAAPARLHRATEAVRLRMGRSPLATMPHMDPLPSPVSSLDPARTSEANDENRARLLPSPRENGFSRLPPPK